MLSGVVLAAGVIGCEPNPRSKELRVWTQDLAFHISSVPSPPVAEGETVFKIVVQDKETGEPIEQGEGRLFASNQDEAKTYDGLAKGKEVGTYYARLRFPVSGEWAMGLQFRRDSTRPLERTEDWRQGVLTREDTGTTKNR